MRTSGKLGGSKSESGEGSLSFTDTKMPLLISKQNTAIAVHARRHKERDVSHMERDVGHTEIDMSHKRESHRESDVSLNSSMKKLKSVAAVIQLKNSNRGNEADGLNNKSRLEDAKQKNHIERWLKSQLGVQGSCAHFLEAHLADKCQSRSAAEKKFRWDIFHFILYSLFLILYSISACGTNMRGMLLARNMLESEIGKFDGVQHIGKCCIVHAVIANDDIWAADVYGYLETVIIPIVTDGGARFDKDKLRRATAFDFAGPRRFTQAHSQPPATL